MKLLFCQSCNHVFSLGYNLRSCECGKVKGRYVDHSNAEVNGEGVALAIGNGALVDAIKEMRSVKEGGRATYRDACRISYAWVRPHEGEGNPHTFVNKELK